jgi:hypothetical protein
MKLTIQYQGEEGAPGCIAPPVEYDNVDTLIKEWLTENNCRHDNGTIIVYELLSDGRLRPLWDWCRMADDEQERLGVEAVEEEL